jgi:hypothetical protein
MSYGPDGAVARKCPGCSFTSWPKPAYDESPHPAYCPMCGLGLVQQRCRECAAPVTAVEGGGFFGHVASLARYCCACGADNATPPEPKMRDKPKKQKDDVAGTFNIVLGSGIITFVPSVESPPAQSGFVPSDEPKPTGSFLLLWPRAQKRIIAVRRERRSPPADVRKWMA